MALVDVRDAGGVRAEVVIDGLGALAHPTRLAAFRLLVRKGSDGETAGELARRLHVPPQTLSFHVKELSRAGLVHGRREGRNVFYAVDFDHARRLIAYLTDSCCAEAASVVRFPSQPEGGAPMKDQDVKQVVQDRYGRAAREVRSGAASCCGVDKDPVTVDLYDDTERAVLPAEALRASLGCGNPTALAELRPGEVVLDLGSGGGIDVLLSARRVGPTGKAYGLDMTDEMLALAEENKARAGVDNVEFLRGEMEDIPLPDRSVDVIISNCVINLSADKDRVFAEAFRVLRPGGRFAVSDMVLRGTLPAEVADLVAAWTGCVAGALEENDYRAKLAAVGFVDIDLQPTREFTAVDAHAFLSGHGLDADRLAARVAGHVFSAFVRARRP